MIGLHRTFTRYSPFLHIPWIVVRPLLNFATTFVSPNQTSRPNPQTFRIEIRIEWSPGVWRTSYKIRSTTLLFSTSIAIFTVPWSIIIKLVLFLAILLVKGTSKFLYLVKAKRSAKQWSIAPESITVAILSTSSSTPMYVFAINITVSLVCSTIVSVCLLPMVTLYD